MANFRFSMNHFLSRKTSLWHPRVHLVHAERHLRPDIQVSVECMDGTNYIQLSGCTFYWKWRSSLPKFRADMICMQHPWQSRTPVMIYISQWLAVIRAHWLNVLKTFWLCLFITISFIERAFPTTYANVDQYLASPLRPKMLWFNDDDFQSSDSPYEFCEQTDSYINLAKQYTATHVHFKTA